MAPITDETVAGLKNIISKLEARVEQLEERLTHGGESSKPKSVAEHVRIVLMGPPGAGTLHSLLLLCSSFVQAVLTGFPV